MATAGNHEAAGLDPLFYNSASGDLSTNHLRLFKQMVWFSHNIVICHNSAKMKQQVNGKKDENSELSYHHLI